MALRFICILGFFFAPVFYLNNEHVLFDYILKRRNFFCGFKKKFADFQELFYKIKNL